jgi:branched-chain amino acid transport system permease protein
MISYLAQQSINALQLGAIYALIALGYSLVYSILSLINFAHGDLFMLGAFIALILAKTYSLPIWLLLLLVILLTGILGGILEQVAYKPLRQAPRVSAIITALGCGLFIENCVLAISPYPQHLRPMIPSLSFHWEGVTISLLQLIIIGTAFLLMLLLELLLTKSSWGIAMRALSQDRGMVSLLGVPGNLIITMTFMLGAGLGGAAGFLYTLSYPIITATMGAAIGWKAFVAAVIGGIGSIRGAMIGGLLLGATEVVSTALLPSTYRDLIVYTLLLLILTIRPYGICGKPSVQKV